MTHASVPVNSVQEGARHAMTTQPASPRNRGADDALNDANAKRDARPDDDGGLTPPLSLVGGEAAENPDAAEERSKRLELNMSADDDPPAS